MAPPDADTALRHRANAAVYFKPDGFDTAGPRLMGRQAAGEGFLKALARHGDVDALVCFADTEAEARTFAGMAAGDATERPVRWVPASRPEELRSVGCLYRPDPAIGRPAWARRRGDQRAYSLCGVTHTTASHAAMDAVVDLLVAPVQPWDALICTSQAVRATLETILDAARIYLHDRLGARRFTLPQLPVIPLGVDCGAFAGDDAARTRWRSRLGIAPDDVAVLFVGRLSFHAKAHPMPMYAALEAAAAGGEHRVHLIQAGWFANEAIERAFRDGARDLCPSVNAVFLDGRDPDVRRGIWTAADIFTSLADNIQETFGLTPVEAMAAGLPAVVSDWDGYRETVRDGEDGFRVPTVMAPPPLGAELARLYEDGAASYDRYCAGAGQLVAIDVGACAQAFRRLIGDASLRRRMGETARRRARTTYDWRVVIARYQELWGALAERRAAAAECAPKRAGAPAHPARQDPCVLFGRYPTALLSADHRLVLPAPAIGADLDAMLGAPANRHMLALLPGREILAGILDTLRQGPTTVGVLLARTRESERRALIHGILWLAKMGLVSIPTPGPTPGE